MQEKAGTCLYRKGLVPENLRFEERRWVELGKYGGRESGARQIGHGE